MLEPGCFAFEFVIGVSCRCPPFVVWTCFAECLSPWSP